jgi:hypothetical protein
MSFEIQNYPTADAAKQALAEALPKGTSRRAVEEFIDQMGIECFPSTDRYVACRYIEPSTNMVHVVWNVAFFFDDYHQLERIVVNRGLTGP